MHEALVLHVFQRLGQVPNHAHQQRRVKRVENCLFEVAMKICGFQSEVCRIGVGAIVHKPDGIVQLYDVGMASEQLVEACFESGLLDPVVLGPST